MANTTPASTMYQLCSKCHRALPTSDFYASKPHVCKACIAEYDAARLHKPTRGHNKVEIDTESSTCKIYLSDTVFTTIDLEDYPKVSKFRWTYKAGYAYSGHGIPMAKVLLDVMPGRSQVVDHISGDKLDNRKSNLRVCTPAQNSANVRKIINPTGFKGIERSGRHSFCAEITCQGIKIRLGSYPSAEEAACAYQVAAQIIYEEFAYQAIDSQKVTAFQKLHEADIRDRIARKLGSE